MPRSSDAPAEENTAARGPTGNTILVVSKKTGLAMETLRAWERRYGFPKPLRKEGSNRRLYSEAEIARLLALKAAIEAGYRIGDVVEKGMDELAVMAREGRRKDKGARAEVSVEDAADLSALISLLQKDDVVGLEDRLRLAASALGPRRFVTEVAHPFVVAVGAAWAEGRIGIRHEHLASECVTTRIRQLLSSYQDMEGRPLVLLSTLPGEPHGLSLQMVALYLAVKSARPRLLGSNTPPEELVRAATELGADVVGVTITEVPDEKEMRRMVRLLRRGLPERVALWLGGKGARRVDPEGQYGQVVSTWDEVDRALEALR
jgi:DNA-binding transcriptional MerR regulator/methanogenic corrinoid protein MtbC1